MFWFTSDTHFGHTNIIKYCKRPFKSIDHMDMEIIRKWNERVNPEDTVFHLGDFSFKETPERNFKYYIDQLNGKIILFKGNHDKNNGSKALLESATMTYGGKDWYLSHRPYESIRQYNLCGHVHDKWEIDRPGTQIYVNMSVDVWDFYPVKMSEVLRRIGAKMHI